MEAYPATGESVSVRLRCGSGDAMLDHEVIKGAREPVRKVLLDLGSDPVVIAVPKKRGEPCKHG